MPRKRTTRVKPPSKPSGKAVDVAQDMSANERKEQLTVFLQEFDFKVKNVLKDIEKKKRTMTVFIQTRFEERIATLPQEIKNMTIREAEGKLDQVVSHVGGPTQEASTLKKRIADVQSLTYHGYDTKVGAEGLETIAESNSDESTGVQPTTAKRKGKRDRAAMPPPSRTSKRTKAQLATPANTASRPIWGQTPLITPKFDPSLPTTPENVREVKPGERLMSLAGSPVQVGVRRKARGKEVNKEKMANELSDIIGVDLTPNRVERMLRLMSGSVNNK